METKQAKPVLRLPLRPADGQSGARGILDSRGRLLAITSPEAGGEIERAEIVRRCNAHEDLVEALLDLRNAVQRAHVDGDGRTPGCAVCMALDNADEILAQATKEETP